MTRRIVFRACRIRPTTCFGTRLSDSLGSAFAFASIVLKVPTRRCRRLSVAYPAHSRPFGSRNMPRFFFDLFFDRYVVLDPGGMLLECPASATAAADVLVQHLLVARAELRNSGSCPQCGTIAEGKYTARRSMPASPATARRDVEDAFAPRGQQLAFDDAMARVGCPDRRIDRLCIKGCSPSPTSTPRRLSRADLVYAASAMGCFRIINRHCTEILCH